MLANITCVQHKICSVLQGRIIFMETNRSNKYGMNNIWYTEQYIGVEKSLS